MKQNRPIVIIHTLLVVGIMLIVASPAFSKELTGDKIIQNVQDTYDKLETLSATFRHEFVWAMVGESEVSEGTMLLSGEDRFRYETGNQIIVSDGSTLWRYNLGSQQIIAENIASADPGSLPRDFLFEFPKQFNVSAVEALENEQYRLDLEPKEAGLGVNNVQVIVDGDKWITTRLSFEDDSGNTTIYELLDAELNVELDETQFHFTPPENATVFDLR